MVVRANALTGGSTPSLACAFGFAASPDGMLYAFGNGPIIDDTRSEVNFLYRFDPASVTWATLWSGPVGTPEDAPWWFWSPGDSFPSVCFHMGLAATPNNKLYLFGGSPYFLGENFEEMSFNLEAVY
jgi:hypothetical protein